MLAIHATMCVININYSSDILFADLAARFRGVSGNFFKVPFYLKFLINFAAEILLDVQFSASNTKLNDTKICLRPFIRPHKFGN